MSDAYFGLQEQMALRARDEISGWEVRGFSSHRHVCSRLLPLLVISKYSLINRVQSISLIRGSIHRSIAPREWDLSRSKILLAHLTTAVTKKCIKLQHYLKYICKESFSSLIVKNHSIQLYLKIAADSNARTEASSTTLRTALPTPYFIFHK